MTGIGKITLSLLILIIAICEAGVTELNVVVNPKPAFQNRTNSTTTPTPAPIKLSDSEQSQVNEHMKKTLELLNSMTPKQRAQTLIAMSTSESALDRYVCNMISGSDRALVRHMNEKLNLIKSIPEDKQPQILAAMQKSNNSADRNLAAVIMKHNEQGGDKNGQRLQAINQLGPHDRDELLKRMESSNNPEDRELAKKILSGGKNDNSNITMLPHSNASSSIASSPVNANKTANATNGSASVAVPRVNFSNAVNSATPQWMPISNNNVSSVAPSSRPIAVNATQAPTLSNTVSTMVPVEIPRPTPSYAPQLQAISSNVSGTAPSSGNITATAPSAGNKTATAPSAGNKTATAPSAGNISATAPSAGNISATISSAGNVSATAQSAASRPVVANASQTLTPMSNASALDSSTIARPATANISQLPIANNNLATSAPLETPRPIPNNATQLQATNSTVLSETPRQAVANTSLPLNQSVPLSGTNNRTASTGKSSLEQNSKPTKNMVNDKISIKKPDFKNIAMLWNASNATDDQLDKTFNSSLDKPGNISKSSQDYTAESSEKKASSRIPSEEVKSPKTEDGKKTLLNHPEDDEILFGAPIPSLLSPENSPENYTSSEDKVPSKITEDAQPWTELNQLQGQNVTDSVNPGDDAMLTMKNSMLIMQHFEKPDVKIMSSEAYETGNSSEKPLQNIVLPEEKAHTDSKESKMKEGKVNAKSNEGKRNSHKKKSKAAFKDDKTNRELNERKVNNAGSSFEEKHEMARYEPERPSIMEAGAPVNASLKAAGHRPQVSPTSSDSKQTVLIQTAPEQSSWFDAIAGYLPSITAYHHSLYADDDTQPILEHIGEAPVPSKTEQLSTEHLGEAPIPSLAEQLPVPEYQGQSRIEADAANDILAEAFNDSAAEAANDMAAEAASDMAADAPNDMAAEAASDMAADVPNDTAAEAASDMAADAADDMAADVPNDMAADASTDIAVEAVNDETVADDNQAFVDDNSLTQ